jgi:hypothetical protein
MSFSSASSRSSDSKLNSIYSLSQRISKRMSLSSADQELKLLICSWNVGNARPPALLDDWIPACGGTFDIIAVGVQECTYSTKAKVRRASDSEQQDQQEYENRRNELDDDNLDRQYFVRQVQTQVGPSFCTVASTHLWQMRLIVCVRKTLHDAVSAVEVTKEATGLGHVAGNKGGLLIKLSVYDTSICFVACHLAAHEAEKFQKRRNNDCAEIIRGCSHTHLAADRLQLKEKAVELKDKAADKLQRAGNKAADKLHKHLHKEKPTPSKPPKLHKEDVMPELTDRYNHAFWFGDLNYRIDLGQTDPEDLGGHTDLAGAVLERGHKEHFTEILELIDQKNWEALLEADGQ